MVSRITGQYHQVRLKPVDQSLQCTVIVPLVRVVGRIKRERVNIVPAGKLKAGGVTPAADDSGNTRW